MKWLVLVFFPLIAWSHPVIYQGGTMLSNMNMDDMTEAGVFYSFTHKWAFGAEYWRLQDDTGAEQELQLARLNHLAWRYNGPASQANLYLVSGIGRAEDGVNENRLGWLGGLETDWETREYFVSGKYLHLASPDFDTGLWIGRVGYSPIIADFNSLQAWVMLQALHDPVTARETKITPLLRLFYRNVLWEMGSSTKGDMFFNWMIHI